MRAAIYARKSTPDEGRSVTRQDEECREAIAANGWTVSRFFADDGLSASRFARKGRAEYARSSGSSCSSSAATAAS
jgi:site-specific DNA recombinase